MMWSTFIVKRFSAAAFLMEKVCVRACVRASMKYVSFISLYLIHTVNIISHFHRLGRHPKIACADG